MDKKTHAAITADTFLLFGTNLATINNNENRITRRVEFL